MALIIVGIALVTVVLLYFKNNPLGHSRKFMIRRFINWFPLGMTYAFLYMGRYNLSVAKNAFGDLMTKESFGIIFGVGTTVYGLSFLLNGPLVDKIGGKKGIIIAAIGSCLANGIMGLVTYSYLHGNMQTLNMTVVFSVLYAVNMFFQSYGAVSIIKIKAYWFHVRERGIFGAIFGTLISFGAYFAFDWGSAIVEAARVNPTTELSGTQQFLRTLFAIDIQPTDSLWLVFFIPSGILIFWALMDMICLKDSPAQANFGDFDPHDASSDEEDTEFSIKDLLKKIFTNPIMLTIAFIEFTSGVLRNGIMQWYFIFAHEVNVDGSKFFLDNWGILVCTTGIFGGFFAGILSDKVFHSRRSPPAVLMNAIMFVLVSLMAIFLFSNPIIVGTSAALMCFAVIGVHSLMSGTAAADFGGRKATATASGIVDGFVYLGSGIQSVAIGFLVGESWLFWPIFLLPFTVMGLLLSLRIWSELPAATKRYLETVEKIQVAEITYTQKVKIFFRKK